MPLTAQEIYDTVKAHLTKQGRRSVTPHGRCMYRTPDNRSCAVGCLLTDEEAHALDTHMLSSLNVLGPTCLPERLRPHFKLLVELQTAHDLAIVGPWLDGLQDRMNRLALRNGFAP